MPKITMLFSRFCYLSILGHSCSINNSKRAASASRITPKKENKMAKIKNKINMKDERVLPNNAFLATIRGKSNCPEDTLKLLYAQTIGMLKGMHPQTTQLEIITFLDGFYAGKMAAELMSDELMALKSDKCKWMELAESIVRKWWGIYKTHLNWGARVSIGEFLKAYDAGKYEACGLEALIAEWWHWDCDVTELKGHMAELVGYLKRLLPSDKIDMDSHCVLFSSKMLRPGFSIDTIHIFELHDDEKLLWEISTDSSFAMVTDVTVLEQAPKENKHLMMDLKATEEFFKG
jgi:hypothetical protein